MTSAESIASPSSGGRRGRLVLVPNALDLGCPPQDLAKVLPQGVIRRAATLAHWVVEDARSARAFLKRVNALAPLVLPLQEIAIEELPRRPKGAQAEHGPGAGSARGARPGAPLAAQVQVPSEAASPWSRLLAPLAAGHDVGLLSEAGLPAVADPGAALVAAAHADGYEVEPLPGPSSLLLALAASGLEGQSFAFVGYLPQDAATRAARIRVLEAASRQARQTQICIETPYRNAALLAALVATLAPASRLSVSVGLTLDGAFTRSLTVRRWRSAGAAAMLLPERVPAVFCFLGA